MVWPSCVLFAFLLFGKDESIFDFIIASLNSPTWMHQPPHEIRAEINAAAPSASFQDAFIECILHLAIQDKEPDQVHAMIDDPYI